MAFWDWPHDENLAATESAIELMLRDVASGKARYWTLRLGSDGPFVGLCDLSDIQAGHSADIGFMLERRFWGAGLAREAVACLMEHARSLGLKTITARIHSGNHRSAHLLQYCGFVEVETLPDYEIRPGVYRDCKRYEVNL